MFCRCVLSLCSVVVFCRCVLSLCSVVAFCRCVLSLCSVVVFCRCVLSLCSVVVFCHCVLSLCSVIVCLQEITWILTDVVCLCPQREALDELLKGKDRDILDMIPERDTSAKRSVTQARGKVKVTSKVNAGPRPRPGSKVASRMTEKENIPQKKVKVCLTGLYYEGFSLSTCAI